VVPRAGPHILKRRETSLLDPDYPTPSLVFKPIEVTHMNGYSDWLTLYSVHVSHSHSLNSSNGQACMHRCMQAQTKKNKHTHTPITFHFPFGVEHNKVFCGKFVNTDDIIYMFQFFF
jgi:hypothetical protein